MPYATMEHLEAAAGGRERFVQLADLDGDGVPDPAVIDAAQAKAEGLIDSYAGKRYKTPIANPSAVLRQIAAEETIYQLLLRSSTGPTEVERDEREHRKSWLEDLARGRVTPSEPAPAASSADRNRYRPSDRAVSRNKMKGYW